MNDYSFHPQAFADLDEYWEYVAARNIDAADRVIGEVFDAIRGLVSFPNMGHRRPDLTRRPLRFHRVRDLLIVYDPDKRPLWIVAVLHGRRNPCMMAAILSGRQGMT
jgi:plasmid stabilization system protein ParE